MNFNSVLFTESEPRDAGTDQRSSGIIRLHTIKQIIDRVSSKKYVVFCKCVADSKNKLIRTGVMDLTEMSNHLNKHKLTC